MNVGLPLADSRRIEVLANRRPSGKEPKSPLTQRWCAHSLAAVKPRPGAERAPGLALQPAANRKRRAVYPELVAARRCKLGVLGVEVGGRIGAGNAWVCPPASEYEGARSAFKIARGGATSQHPYVDTDAGCRSPTRFRDCGSQKRSTSSAPSLRSCYPLSRRSCHTTCWVFFFCFSSHALFSRLFKRAPTSPAGTTCDTPSRESAMCAGRPLKGKRKRRLRARCVRSGAGGRGISRYGGWPRMRG